MSKNVEVIATDSGKVVSSKNGYLLGGKLVVALGRVAGMINTTNIKRDIRG